MDLNQLARLEKEHPELDVESLRPLAEAERARDIHLVQFAPHPINYTLPRPEPEATYQPFGLGYRDTRSAAQRAEEDYARLYPSIMASCGITDRKGVIDLSHMELLNGEELDLLDGKEGALAGVVEKRRECKAAHAEAPPPADGLDSLEAVRKISANSEYARTTGGPTQPVLCSACLAPHASKRCKRCKVAYYCNEACQRRHWREKHRSECREVPVQ
jgi:hypothetical protein